ncbi:hypothetical protein LCGC14_0164870 [marine sediment metagenome]|uniref:Uncharacterized protein n=1 Tax=marine sediment metagenome TaxID=412755 RepID=A0A0F9XWQ2_9ZZZZ
MSAYSPAAGVTGIIKSVSVCNVNGAKIAFSIFLDDDGAVFDENTALYFEAELSKGQTFEREVWWPMNNLSGNLGVQVDTAQGASFTFHGAEVTP